MKLILKTAIAAGLLALGACNNHTDAGQNVADNAENVADNLEATADNVSNDAARPGERIVARRWRRKWRNFEFKLTHAGSKGTLIGRRLR